MIELEIIKTREEGLRLLAQREYQREETKYKEIVEKAHKIRAIKEEQRKS